MSGGITEPFSSFVRELLRIVNWLNFRVSSLCFTSVL